MRERHYASYIYSHFFLTPQRIGFMVPPWVGDPPEFKGLHKPNFPGKKIKAAADAGKLRVLADFAFYGCIRKTLLGSFPHSAGAVGQRMPAV